MARGVPAGFKHKWKYKGHWKERKRRDGSWDINFTARKSRRGAKRGSFPIGSKIVWNIRGKQTAQKMSDGTYKTTFRARKTVNRVKVAKRRRKK